MVATSRLAHAILHRAPSIVSGQTGQRGEAAVALAEMAQRNEAEIFGFEPISVDAPAPEQPMATGAVTTRPARLIVSGQTGLRGAVALHPVGPACRPASESRVFLHSMAAVIALDLLRSQLPAQTYLPAQWIVNGTIGRSGKDAPSHVAPGLLDGAVQGGFMRRMVVISAMELRMTSKCLG